MDLNLAWHLLALANPGATVFGATLLAGGVNRNWYALQVMAVNNRRWIFSNAGDDLAGLEDALNEHLDDVSVRIVGCVALSTGSALDDLSLDTIPSDDT